ncbi:16S rRNA (cytosine(1402)-N(4))-methyltransferase RsmH [Patescibacteria group bacterium]|nr:16S rRNA (cytosine(1402)-N(4))-methyltransferase RsmH [Patescibacteria group bacterium]
MTAPSLTSAGIRSRLPREEGSFARQQNLGNVTHISVMPKESLELLDIKAGELVVDGTAGEGGHSFEILKHSPKARVLALDADPAAVVRARERLAQFGQRAEVVEANFSELEKVLAKKGIKEINKALFDLGWNSGQLGDGRGFSFLTDEPLNMSYGKKPASGFTAAEALNEWDEETLANVFYGYGEERFARRIAKAVIERREIQPIKTTFELVEIVRDSTPRPYHKGRIHFATRTFQAMRMAVNDELGVINTGLTAAWSHLSVGGRIAVITFHSIEDRAVKRLFAEFAKKEGKLIVKKPLIPDRAEIINNPRARSAKLRVIEKTS